MGQLTITVGSITGSKTFSDANGATIIGNYIESYGGPVDGTNQQKMDWFIDHLAQHVHSVHIGYKRSQAAEQARQDAEETAEEWNA